MAIHSFMKPLLVTSAFFCLLILLSSCGSNRSIIRGNLSDSFCDPALAYTYDSTYLPRPSIQPFLQANPILRQRYSQHDLLLANATGTLSLLRELHQLETNSSVDTQQEQLTKRQQILHRLLLASTEISSLAAELDCEGERADQLAEYLDQRDDRRVRRLTILSIVVGAVTTVVSTLIQADTPDKVIGIGGGVASAALGGLAAFSSQQTVSYQHPRNLLTDVWRQRKASSVYPPFVWYVLNEPAFSNSGQRSISANIRQRWLEYVLPQPSPEQEKLFFGTGGAYQADDLHTRANMLNQLQSSVRSIDQNLQGLILTLSN
ncbi:hypothetical protein GCM10028817_08250 [Spirosoma pomorum]